MSPAERMIEAKLREPVSLNFKDATLEDVILTLRTMSGLNIVPDVAALRSAGNSLDQSVTLRVESIRLKSARSFEPVVLYVSDAIVPAR